MSATCFDYFPWLRPAYIYQWPNQISRTLETLIAAGGRKNRWYATDFLTTVVNTDNPALAALETRDFYLAVPPASWIWGLSVYGASTLQVGNLTNPSINANAGLEIEIIDTCTRLPWWRTSQSHIELGEVDYQEPNTVKVTAVFQSTDLAAYAFGMWLLAKPHLTADPGTQMVRLTANGPALSSGTPDAQVVLWVSVQEGVE